MEKKPRIYWTRYPSSGRGYWRVSEMPKPFKRRDWPRWEAAHIFIHRLNEKIEAVYAAEAELNAKSLIESLDLLLVLTAKNKPVKLAGILNEKSPG